MSPDSNPKSPDDLTPSVGAATDISRLGRTTPKPAHEMTANEDAQVTDWGKVAAMEEFRVLLKAKVKFIVPATIFFIAYYFALLILVGYAREWMEKPVFGVINLAYLFALSQFIMAWVLAALYVRAAGRFDKMAAAILSKLNLK
jgi:uncharacterized membrane protein (DUF485 family)